MLMLKRTYPGSASLFQDIGKKMVIYLRDGRVYIGFLRIIDQFAIERIHVGKKFCDIPRGILIIRGENIILIGEVVSPVIYAIINLDQFKKPRDYFALL
ncbi:unnamed protein product [Echinostoma caproni]|uniref:U6 snRNA-associated Sm-like protein LSm1 n=1 Tax=Echinostoma caproni TaxID=27848 RepID=A0A3P8H6B1_9TREM|nr:unnamed protein product [Echinostoma caproni]